MEHVTVRLWREEEEFEGRKWLEPEDHSVRVKGKRQVSGVPGKVKEVSLELSRVGTRRS